MVLAIVDGVGLELEPTLNSCAGIVPLTLETAKVLVPADTELTGFCRAH